MIDIELRMEVAEALGCKVFPSKGALTCGCDLYIHCAKESFELKPYESDAHAALDALREFCEKNDLQWECGQSHSGIHWAVIRAKVSSMTKAHEGHADVALAICFTIWQAAESVGMRK